MSETDEQGSPPRRKFRVYGQERVEARIAAERARWAPPKPASVVDVASKTVPQPTDHLPPQAKWRAGKKVFVFAEFVAASWLVWVMVLGRLFSIPILLEDPFKHRVKLYFSVLVVIAGLSYFLWMVYRERVEAASDRALLEDPDVTDVFLVSVSIHYGLSICSTDRGVVFFQQNALHFVGRRTSFVIGGQDVFPMESYETVAGSRKRDRPYSIRLDHPEKNIGIVLRPTKVGRNHREDAKRFVAALADFRDNPKPSDAARQYPPLGDDR